MSAGAWTAPPNTGARIEFGKLAAFLRRDFLVAWSYRLAFVTDAVGLLAQALLFSYVARMVDPQAVPTYGGQRPGYLAYVAVGIALTSFLQIGLGRMSSVLRSEQLAGTLETLLLTPTRLGTFQLGSVLYDLLYAPLQIFAFLAASTLLFGVHLDAGGVLPAVAVLLAFLPFTWGLGIASAAGVLTFRRGGGVFGFGGYVLTFLSGAYFPLELFPGWLQAVAQYNPIAVALDAMRQALLGGAGWSVALGPVLLLSAASAAALLVGFAAFRAALRRELRNGTLGLY